MSVVRRLAPKICPNCNASDSLFVDMDKRLTCRLCGHKVGQQAETNPEPEEKLTVIRPEDRDLRPQYGITHRGEVNSWAKAAYTSGQDAIYRKDYESAIRSFERALDSQHDFLDAHLWIARLSTDPAIKRDHIEDVLVQEPTNKDALIELMLLEGKITVEQADRIESFDDPILKQALNPVATQSKNIVCPICGGDDYLLEDDGEIQCHTCGYLGEPEVEEDEEPAGYGTQSLTMALLERRGQGVVWHVGKHLLKCDNCGAERTITRKMSQRCPFCGSKQVIESDALESFQEPDGVIPFRLSEEQAQEAVHVAVNSGFEKIKGWFVNQRIKTTMINGIYVPFWMFDFALQVSKTITDKRSNRNYTPGLHQAYHNETIADMLNNVPISAVKSPPVRLLKRLGRYDHNAIIGYEPEVLSRYSAEMYTIDFDKASLSAREVVSETMREKHGITIESEISVTVMTHIQNATFRLVLLPVWVVTIIEDDGDVRLALVNGQAGTVALGRAKKSEQH